MEGRNGPDTRFAGNGREAANTDLATPAERQS